MLSYSTSIFHLFCRQDIQSHANSIGSMRPIVPWLPRRGAIIQPRIFKSIFYQKPSRCWLSTTAHDKQTKPLRILFCGSDTFSARSLHALFDEAKSADSHILSIDVVTWKDKYGGRNNATLRSPFIKKVALEMGLLFIKSTPSMTGRRRYIIQVSTLKST